MMNWQELFVGVLLFICFIRISVGIYRFYQKVKEQENPCAGCVSDCEIKRLYDKRCERKASEQKKTKKSCCG